MSASSSTLSVLRRVHGELLFTQRLMGLAISYSSGSEAQEAAHQSNFPVPLGQTAWLNQTREAAL
jgi:hypothetical protein